LSSIPSALEEEGGKERKGKRIDLKTLERTSLKKGRGEGREKERRKKKSFPPYLFIMVDLEASRRIGGRRERKKVEGL